MRGGLGENAALAYCEQLSEDDYLCVGCHQVSDGDWKVEVLLDSETAARLLSDALFANASAADMLTVTIAPVPELDWVVEVQAGLPPVFVGPFMVHGSHDRKHARGRRLTIEIDAQTAFGTAHHATTLGCLRALVLLARQRHFKRVLDLGCGSGILAIAATQLLPSASVHACDIDPEAVTVARRNARLNRVVNRLSISQAAGLEHRELRCGRKFDLVMANVLAEPLIVLAPQLSARVVFGGAVVLSGLLTHQARRVCATYRAAGFELATRIVLDKWVTMIMQRRK